jgi:hypothetical protein
LDRAAEVLQLDPLHFNSIESKYHPVLNACDDTWFQYDWQNVGKVSRETLARALKIAEDSVHQLLGYSLLPQWFLEEEHPIDRPYAVELQSNGLTSRGGLKSIDSNWGYVIGGGIRGKTLITAGSPVAYTDDDGDLYKERATVVVNTTVTDPEEISLFYPGKDGEEDWEIRPINVVIDMVLQQATITFYKHMVPLESLLGLGTPDGESSPPMINGDDDANFLQTVDAYRIYNDPSLQGRLTVMGGCSVCGGSGCEFCVSTNATACLYVKDGRVGRFIYQLADWDTTTGAYKASSYCGPEPDKIKLWYRAGLRDFRAKFPTKQMDVTWERALVYYALTLIDSELGGCANFVQHAQYMKEDLALVVTGRRNQLHPADLLCPLGTQRSAIHLWRKINSPGIRLVKG